MRGQATLIAMRRNGERPAVVFIDTDAGPDALPRWAQWQNVDEALCNLDITPNEPLTRIDFRPLVGLRVHVSGTNEKRVRTIAQLVKEAGADRVISNCVKQISYGEEIAFKTLWIEDTYTEEETNGERAA